MNQLFSEDLTRMIQVMEEYIITEEERLVELGLGDTHWDKLIPYKSTLNNLNYLESIYGQR